MIQLRADSLVTAALLVLILPLDWLLAGVLAAAFHELCHILAVYALKGRILDFKILSGGCVLKTDPMGQWQQCFCILAGPLGSLSLLLLCRMAPKLAIMGLLQGLYNLLPVLPLDGGRMLQLLLWRVCPLQADRWMDFVAVGSCIALDLAATWYCLTLRSGIWPIIVAVSWNIKFLPGKIPCKPMKIGVQ